MMKHTCGPRWQLPPLSLVKFFIKIGVKSANDLRQSVIQKAEKHGPSDCSL